MTTQMNRQQATTLLTNNVCNLQFTNASGETIQRKGTLMQSQIPQASQTVTQNDGQGQGQISETTGQQNFYDMDNNKISSFLIENLISIEPTAQSAA